MQWPETYGGPCTVCLCTDFIIDEVRGLCQVWHWCRSYWAKLWVLRHLPPAFLALLLYKLSYSTSRLRHPMPLVILIEYWKESKLSDEGQGLCRYLIKKCVYFRSTQCTLCLWDIPLCFSSLFRCVYRLVDVGRNWRRAAERIWSNNVNFAGCSWDGWRAVCWGGE